MKVVEGRKYSDTQRFDLADYMKNFSREQQTRPETNKKLTLADLMNHREKSNKDFIIDKQSEF
jgi:hypothetical protein